jgi:putative transposase
LAWLLGWSAQLAIGAAGWAAAQVRLVYPGVTDVFEVLRLLPMSNRDTDVETVALRHQITVLERPLGGEKVRFDAADRALLAALLHRLPRDVLRRVRLLERSGSGSVRSAVRCRPPARVRQRRRRWPAVGTATRAVPLGGR